MLQGFIPLGKKLSMTDLKGIVSAAVEKKSYLLKMYIFT